MPRGLISAGGGGVRTFLSSAAAAVVGGTFPGQSGNLVGFSNTPAAPAPKFTALNGQTWPGAYPGSLTAWPGGTGNQNITDGTFATSGAGTVGNPYVFAFYDFNAGAGLTQISVANSIFVGCRFQSNSVANTNINLPAAFSNINFVYCSVVPLASLYTSPPGYLWPSAGTLQNTTTQTSNVNCIDGNSGYQGGISLSSGGPSIIDHCDIWGFGNAIIFNTGTTNVTVSDTHIHDSANPSPQSYHTDGPGYLNGGTPPSNITVDHCTIASIGNTNGIAYQAATSGYSGMTVNNCYLTGFGFLVDMCHGVFGSTNLLFTNNTIGTDVLWFFGPVSDDTFLFSQPTNSWKNNKLHYLAGTTNPNGYTIADDGKFLWPEATVSTTDWNPKALQFSSATHATGGSTSTTVSMNIGTAVSPFVVVIVRANGLSTPTMTVGGVTMTKDVQNTTNSVIFSGVATGQSGNVSVTITDSGIFGAEVDFALFYSAGHTWALHATNTNTGSSVTVAVTAGDAIVACAVPAANFNSSTVLPSATRFIDTGNTAIVGDWEDLQASNAAFSIADSTLPTAFFIAASYTPS
jgi:hypothetical protein